MYACDFEFDGQNLSDFGFIVCEYDGGTGSGSFSVGSTITFNTVARQSGKVYGLVGTQYDECVTATFHICKDPEKYDDLEITDDECREIVRWLNRREFLPFRLIYDDDDERICWYDASFNISKLKLEKDLYALELTMTSNKPFGYGDTVTTTVNVTSTSSTYLVTDTSDEIGYIYPKLTITLNESGNFTLYNSLEDITVSIANCTSGEVITMSGDSLIISSSLASHDIADDFNYEFFRIGNTYDNRKNYLTANLKCTLEITYNPIIKDSPI